MKIFIAGATGAVGRPLVSACIKAGHSVIGLTRTPAKGRTHPRDGCGTRHRRRPRCGCDRCCSWVRPGPTQLFMR